MLIAEDLLLLLTDDTSGKLVVPGEQVDVALGGALLVELSLAERVRVDERGRLALADTGPAGDALLDAALATVSRRQGKKPRTVVAPLGKGARAVLHERLVGRGVLRHERGRLLGVFPTSRWPAEDARHEAAVRDALTQVLVVGTTPEPRTAALVGLLQALRAVPKVVDPQQSGMSRRELDRRAKQVAEGDWGSKAVRESIDATNAAVLAAVTAATTSAGGD